METKPLILVCDDNKSITQLIVFVLQKAGYRAQAVGTAAPLCDQPQRQTHQRAECRLETAEVHGGAREEANA